MMMMMMMMIMMIIIIKSRNNLEIYAFTNDIICIIILPNMKVKIIMMITIIIIIHYFNNFRAELNSQWPITESARIQTAIRQRKDKTHTKRKIKIDQLFALKHELFN
jgi:hypothetical protein